MSDSDPPPGDIVFYDDYLPAIPAATYTVTVSHRIDIAGAAIPAHTRTVEVAGPRFALADDDVHSVHPPDQSSGHFSHELPQIVLSRRVIPWEREVGEDPPSDQPRRPWLALLLLEQDEIVRSSPPEGMPAKDLIVAAPNVVPPSLVVNDDEKTLICRTIEISGDLFLRLAPRLDELAYLAHCRNADVSGKADLGLVESGWFSVVVANRLPRAATAQEPAGVAHVAHLVSMEGWDKVIAANHLPSGCDVRLVSLASWSFKCLDDLAETFAGLAGAVAETAHSDGKDVLLRLPLHGQDSATQARLDAGFVPTAYRTRTGDETIAWYRGPLSPTVAAAANEPDTGAAGQPIVYVAGDGMFDLSLAAAWQLGRSLAIADAGFIDALVALRLNGRRLVDRLAAFKETGTPLPAKLPDVNAANPAIERMFKALTGGLAGHVAAAAQSGVVGSSTPGTALPVPPIEVIRGLFQDAQAIPLMTEQAGLDAGPIAAWLARLRLLRGVPFDYLVPRAEMLPVERLRLFTLDPAWIAALVNGVFSLAGGSSLDASYLAVARPIVEAQVQANLAALAQGADTSAAQLSGILLRSDLVGAFPGLTIRPFRNETLLPILRIEQLSGSVMLCLFLGLADRIELCEPREGLRFGVDENRNVVIRQLTGDRIGAIVPGADPNLPKTLALAPEGFPGGGNLRAGSDRVLAIADALAPALATACGVSKIGPAQFALLMVNAPERAVFKPSPVPAEGG